MAGNDKHPPLNPKRHSTNKRVKVGEQSFTGAKKVPATVTPSKKREAAQAAAVKTFGDKIATKQKKHETSLGMQKKTGVIRDIKPLYRLSKMNRVRSA